MPKPTVLVADDDKVVSGVLSTFLRQNGFNVVVAFDAIQAWIMSVKNPPTAILLDILMPGGSGMEVLRKLKTSTKTGSVIVLAMTASNDPSLPAKAKEMGAEGFLRKPIDLENLRQLLSRVIGEPTIAPGPG
jgi:CheY-like chemotaxis protein